MEQYLYTACTSLIVNKNLADVYRKIGQDKLTEREFSEEEGWSQGRCQAAAKKAGHVENEERSHKSNDKA